MSPTHTSAIGCPRLMAYQVSGKNKAWTVGLKGGGNFPGKIFHDLVAQQFHTRMCQGPKNDTYLAVDLLMQKKDRDLNTGLYAILDKHILEPLLESKASEMKGDQITALATGINHWSPDHGPISKPDTGSTEKRSISALFSARRRNRFPVNCFYPEAKQSSWSAFMTASSWTPKPGMSLSSNSKD